MKLQFGAYTLSLDETEYNEVFINAEKVIIVDSTGKKKLISFDTPTTLTSTQSRKTDGDDREGGSLSIMGKGSLSETSASLETSQELHKHPNKKVADIIEDLENQVNCFIEDCVQDRSRTEELATKINSLQDEFIGQKKINDEVIENFKTMRKNFEDELKKAEEKMFDRVYEAEIFANELSQDIHYLRKDVNRITPEGLKYQKHKNKSSIR